MGNPFAIGTFADAERDAFPGLVLGGDRVLALSGLGWPTTRAVLAGGHAALTFLPVGPWTVPARFAGMTVAYLASTEARAVTGQALRVDGGHVTL